MSKDNLDTSIVLDFTNEGDYRNNGDDPNDNNEGDDDKNGGDPNNDPQYPPNAPPLRPQQQHQHRQYRFNITPTPELSKEVLAIQTNKIKQIADWDPPALTPKSSDEEFSDWLKSTDGLLGLLGLKQIPLITKGVKIKDEATYKKNIYDAIVGVNDFRYVKETLIKGQEFSDVDENTDQFFLNMIVVATFDAFPKLEEHLYRKLESTLGKKFSHIMPPSFHKGAVLMIYTSVSNEFRRPHQSAAFSEYLRYTQDGKYVLEEHGDPRTIAARINIDGDLINQMYSTKYVTDFVKAGLLRKAIKNSHAYEERVKRHDENKGDPDFNTLVRILEQEYLNYHKKNPDNQLSSNLTSLDAQPNAHHASEQRYEHKHDYDSKNPSEDTIYVPHGYLNQDTAMWVEVPKGNCLQYAIRGKCTRDNCEYKHVPGTVVDTPPERKRRLDSNRDRNKNQSNRFNSRHPQQTKGKDFKSNRKKKLDRKMQKITANLTKLLLAQNDSPSDTDDSVSDSLPQTDSSDSDSQNNGEAKAFLSALKAKFYKKAKSFRKPKRTTNFNNLKKSKNRSKHPNKKSFNDKMKELKKKDDGKKTAYQAALLEAMLQDRGFELQSDSDESSE
jgi:hypothetical protein